MLVLKPSIFELNLTLKRGADSVIELTIVDRDKRPIINPTGYSAQAAIRAVPDPNSAALFEWNNNPSTAQGFTVITYSTDTLKSVLTLSLTGAQSALFTFTAAYWDCFVTSPLGEIDCIAGGIVTITPRYTY